MACLVLAEVPRRLPVRKALEKQDTVVVEMGEIRAPFLGTAEGNWLYFSVFKSMIFGSPDALEAVPNSN